MIRNLKILIKQASELSFAEFFYLISRTLFFNEPIIVYKLDLSTKVVQRFEQVDGVEIKKGNFDDLEQARQTLKPLPWEFQCHEFDGVEDFFVARDDGGVQHISWVYLHHDRNRLLTLGDREAEIKFCLTLPALRGRGIYPRVILLILNYLNLKGIHRVFMCVHRDNQPSIRGIEKAGFMRVSEVRLRKFMGIQISSRFDTSRVQ